MYRKYVECEIVEAIRAQPGKMFSSVDLVELVSTKLGKPIHATNIAFYLNTLERHGFIELISVGEETNGKYRCRAYRKKHQLDYYEPRFVREGFEVNTPRVNDCKIPSQKEAL